MDTQELGLKEKLAIVEKALLIEASQTYPDKFVLVPDNNAEVFIPIDSTIDFKCIGGVRSIALRSGQAYFLMPRRRGAEIALEGNSKFFILKINPIYAKKITSGLDEVSTGIFEMGLNSEQIGAICDGYEMDKYELSDLMENLLSDASDIYDYNMTILDALEQIRQSCGTTSVKEIYSNLGVSKSKLEQHFNREIGLTPKECCKIQKINCFINTYRESDDLSLTELTYQCGYYDQSHLIKDFKYFLDTSPKKFFCDQK